MVSSERVMDESPVPQKRGLQDAEAGGAPFPWPEASRRAGQAGQLDFSPSRTCTRWSAPWAFLLFVEWQVVSGDGVGVWRAGEVRAFALSPHALLGGV